MLLGSRDPVVGQDRCTERSGNNGDKGVNEQSTSVIGQWTENQDRTHLEDQ